MYWQQDTYKGVENEYNTIYGSIKSNKWELKNE